MQLLDILLKAAQHDSIDPLVLRSLIRRLTMKPFYFKHVKGARSRSLRIRSNRRKAAAR